MLFFDRVLVPWDRLFFLYESARPLVTMLGAAGGSAKFNFAGWANLERVSFRYRLHDRRRHDGGRGDRRHRVSRGRRPSSGEMAT